MKIDKPLITNLDSIAATGFLKVAATTGLLSVDTTTYLNASNLNLQIVNGFTDEAINAAITALGSAGGIVYFPTGTYTINSQILVQYANTTFVGAGPSTRLLCDLWANWGAPADMIYVNQKNNFKIINMMLDGNSANTGQNFNLLYVYKQTGVSIDGCIFTYSDYKGAYIEASNEVTITNSTFSNCDDSGVHTDGYDNHGAGGYAGGAKYVIEGNTFISNVYGYTDYYAKNPAIVGNSSYSDTYGINMAYGLSYGCTISGNTIYSPSRGIYIYNVSPCTIVGNAIYNASYRALVIDGGNNISIIGNTILTSADEGIGVANGGAITGLVIKGNSISGVANNHNDIWFSDSNQTTGVIIEGNVFKATAGNSERAVFIQKVAGAKICNNISSGHDTSFVSTTALSSGVELSNNLATDTTKLVDTAATSYYDVPVLTSATQPAAPETGMIYYTGTKYQGYSGAVWKDIAFIDSPTFTGTVTLPTQTNTVAALKLPTGTLLSTTAAGALENDGTHLYFTFANSGTRYQLDQQAATLTRATFVNGDLTAGVLTVTHNKGLAAPYSVSVVVFDNNAKQIIPDVVTGLTNTFTIDLTSYGTLTGTWGYAYVA